MRQVPSAAGPVDAGPTVLTMKPVFEKLFADVGLKLEDVVSFHSQPLLARHFWRDGTVLDLMQDANASRKNIHAAFGPKSAAEFAAFHTRAAKLFEAFDGPMMQSAAPSLLNLTRVVAARPRLLRAMDPLRNLEASLNRQFSNPRLAQLFARYATYVGGLPQTSPALLALIWHAENRGVWHVEGGMHALAKCIANTATRFGAEIHYNAHVTRIETQDGKACAVQTDTGRLPVDAVVFNGDPRALETGALGPGCTTAVDPSASTPRSLSAYVMSFAAEPAGVDLAAHNVFFAQDPHGEYAPLGKGDLQPDPTLYVCAQDRFGPAPPTGAERFEIILNSPPLDTAHPQDPDQTEKVKQQCQTLILKQLRAHGLTFSPTPQPEGMAGPQDFHRLFPASTGSLYGRAPQGMMAAFKRPTARAQVPGVYLTGGGAHPGAGVPMAVLSAQHAAATILKDLPLM